MLNKILLGHVHVIKSTTKRNAIIVNLPRREPKIVVHLPSFLKKSLSKNGAYAYKILVLKTVHEARHYPDYSERIWKSRRDVLGLYKVRNSVYYRLVLQNPITKTKFVKNFNSEIYDYDLILKMAEAERAYFLSKMKKMIDLLIEREFKIIGQRTWSKLLIATNFESLDNLAEEIKERIERKTPC